MSFGKAWTLAVMAAALASPALAQGAKGKDSVELTDPAGDVQPGNTSDGTRAPLDVVKLAIRSDGKDIIAGATLKDELGKFATNAVELYFDVDNKATTGVETFWGKKPGFEYVAEVSLCIEYEGGGTSCGGGMSSKVKRYYGAASVKRFGKDNMTKDSVRSSFDAPETPVQGKLVEARIGYADLGLKPGQTVRIAARESDSSYDEKSFFPDVTLTLK